MVGRAGVERGVAGGGVGSSRGRGGEGARCSKVGIGIINSEASQFFSSPLTNKTFTQNCVCDSVCVYFVSESVLCVFKFGL
jgi:hypothetical protein